MQWTSSSSGRETQQESRCRASKKLRGRAVAGVRLQIRAGVLLFTASRGPQTDDLIREQSLSARAMGSQANAYFRLIQERVTIRISSLRGSGEVLKYIVCQPLSDSRWPLRQVVSVPGLGTCEVGQYFCLAELAIFRTPRTLLRIEHAKDVLDLAGMVRDCRPSSFGSGGSADQSIAIHGLLAAGFLHFQPFQVE